MYKICQSHSFVSIHSPFHLHDKNYFVSGLALIVCSDWWNDTEGNKNAVSDNIRIHIPGIVVSGLVKIDYVVGMNSFSVRIAM
jgi:hypothetical protein